MSSHSPLMALMGMMLTLNAKPAVPGAVVGRLGDRARDVRSVPVEVDRRVVVPDEVVAGHELRARQVGRLGEGALIEVRDAAVDDGDDDGVAGAELMSQARSRPSCCRFHWNSYRGSFGR